GRALLYEYDGLAWGQAIPFITAETPEPGEHFGRAVALSSDRLVIGAYLDGSGDLPMNAGSVTVHDHTGARVDTLTEQHPARPGDKVGTVLARYRGSTERVVVGACGLEAALVYDAEGDDWRLLRVLTPPVPQQGGSQFGCAVHADFQ